MVIAKRTKWHLALGILGCLVFGSLLTFMLLHRPASRNKEAIAKLTTTCLEHELYDRYGRRMLLGGLGGSTEYEWELIPESDKPIRTAEVIRLFGPADSTDKVEDNIVVFRYYFDSAAEAIVYEGQERMALNSSNGW